MIDGWRTKSLHGEHDGLAIWSTAELVDFFKTGRTDITAAFAAMAEVVEHSTQYMILLVKRMTGQRATNPKMHATNRALDSSLQKKPLTCRQVAFLMASIGISCLAPQWLYTVLRQAAKYNDRLVGQVVTMNQVLLKVLHHRQRIAQQLPFQRC